MYVCTSMYIYIVATLSVYTVAVVAIGKVVFCRVVLGFNRVVPGDYISSALGITTSRETT